MEEMNNDYRFPQCPWIVLPSEIKEEEVEWKKSIPCGVRFSPSNEVIFYYLHMKIHTGHIDYHGIIRDIDIYKYEPEELKDFAFDHGDGRLYFFTPLKRKFPGGKKIQRLTNLGSWKITQKIEKILGVDGSPIMDKTPLCYFHRRNGNPKNKTQWLMDEYRFINRYNHPVMLENWALCVVHYEKRGNIDDTNDSTTDAAESSLSIPQLPIGNNNYFNGGSSTSSYPQGITRSCPQQPFQSNNPRKRQQPCSSIDVGSSLAQYPKRTSAIAIGSTPNFDQNQLACHAPVDDLSNKQGDNNVHIDHMVDYILSENPGDHTSVFEYLNSQQTNGNTPWFDDSS